jgi:capsular polysaccharide biosynthesis protein
LNGPVIGSDAKSLANYLGKAMAAELKNIQANSRVNILTGKAALCSCQPSRPARWDRCSASHH